MSEPNDLPGFMPTELDNQVNSLINQIAAEQADEVIAGDTNAGAIPDAAKTAPVETPAEPTPQAHENTVAAPQDPTDRGLERLVAREVELRERESKLTEAQKEMEALRNRLRELEPRAISPEHLERIKLSPNEGLRALGLDPDEVVRTALMEKLGDKANDPAIRDMMERTRMRKEMDALKGQIREAEMRQAAQAYFNQVSAGARDFSSNIEGLGKHAPTVAHVAKTNPDRVHAEIMEEITRDAAVRSAREPNGDVISYEEAAKRVETRWSAMKSLLAPALSVESTQNPAPNASMSVPKTTPGANPAPKSPPSTIKPPDRPMAPWLQANKDEDEAIREAMLEWQRLESARRR